MQTEPIYVISGKERRNLKKELGNLKHFVKMFWFCEDIDRVYGGGMCDSDAYKLLAEKEIEIKKLEEQLNKKL